MFKQSKNYSSKSFRGAGKVRFKHKRINHTGSFKKCPRCFAVHYFCRSNSFQQQRQVVFFCLHSKEPVQQQLVKQKQQTGNCATTTSCEITGLQAGTDYEVTVRGTYAAGGTSENGPSVTFTTGLRKDFSLLLAALNMFFYNTVSTLITFLSSCY